MIQHERKNTMNCSIHKYFKVGVIHWMSFPPQDYPPLDSLKMIAHDDFFDVIELTQTANEETKKLTKKILDETHLKVCYGAQPRLLAPKLNPNAIDENERLKAEATLLEAIDEAHYLGAKGIAFLAGKWEIETKDTAYQQLLKTTKNLCAYAKTKDMMIELEVFDYDMDKAALIGPAPYARDFACDVKKEFDNFGLIVDLSHFPTTYEDSKFAITTMKDYITHFHIGNAVVKEGCEAYGDQHPRFGFPNSANDVAELVDFFEVLKEEGFFCAENPYVLSIEVKPWADEDALSVLANTKRVINRAWSLVTD